MTKNTKKNNAFGYYTAENPTAALRTLPRRVFNTSSTSCLRLVTDFRRLATPFFLK